MQQAFEVVIFGVVVVSAVVALVTLGSSRRAYAQVGADGLNDGSDRPSHEPTHGAGYAAVRDDEIRQMLQARNARRVRLGQAPLDLQSEMDALAAAPVMADPGLAAEVRALVVARNRRRAKQGKPPLDVGSEVARQLRELR